MMVSRARNASLACRFRGGDCRRAVLVWMLGCDLLDEFFSWQSLGWSCVLGWEETWMLIADRFASIHDGVFVRMLGYYTKSLAIRVAESVAVLLLNAFYVTR